MSQGMQRSIKLSLTCSRAIAESIVFADLGSPISFVRCDHSPLFLVTDLVTPRLQPRKSRKRYMSPVWHLCTRCGRPNSSLILEETGHRGRRKLSFTL